MRRLFPVLRIVRGFGWMVGTALGCVAAGAQSVPAATITTLTGVISPINYGDVIADTGVEGVYTLVDGQEEVVSGGDINFLIDGVITCSLTAGQQAACPDTTGAGYPVGTYEIQSVYEGDASYDPSQSTVQTVVILPIATSSPNPSTVGQSVTFTAVVGDPTATATGTVQFLEGTTLLGKATVSGNGTATYATSTLSAGKHSITVCLLDSEDGKTYCSATVLVQVVNALPPVEGGFTLTVTPTALSVGVGNTLTAQVEVTEVNGVSPPVQLSCTGLPNEMTCAFSQSLIGAGGGSTGVIVGPSAPHTCGSSTPDFVAPNVKRGVIVLGFSMLAVLGLRRRRRLMRKLALAIMLSVLPWLGGCGSRCKDFGTEPGTYTIQVTGTAIGTSIGTAGTQTVAVKVNVHL